MKNLLEYIKGLKKGKTAHDLEREAMNDPFLQDALEGYDEVEGSHYENIEQMQKEILSKVTKKKNYKFYWYSAASLIFLISFGVFIFIKTRENKLDYEIAYQTQKEKINEELSPVLKQENRIILEENNQSTENENYNKRYEQPLIASTNAKKAIKDIPVPSLAPTPLGDHENYTAIEENAEQSKISEIHSLDSESTMTYGLKDTTLIVSKIITEEKHEKDENIPLAYNEKSNKSKSRAKQDQRKVLKNNNHDIATDSRFIFSQPTIGIDNYNEYLKNGLSFSEKDECGRIKGEVIISFIVDSSTGIPKDLKIIKPLCKSLDDQLIELIKKGPQWTEGEGYIQFVR